MHPVRLITPRRLDLVVKFLFFRALHEGGDIGTYEALYRKHIRIRTGGREPADLSTGETSDKTTIDHYVHGCHELLASMRGSGFVAAGAVPVAPGLAIANGAHRVACAAALGLEVAVKTCPVAGPAWDFTWFRTHGFTDRELALILHGWCELHGARTGLFLLWAPAESEWSKVQQGMARVFEPVGWLDFDCGDRRHLFASVLADIYSHGHTAAAMPHIDRKLAELAPFPARFRLLVGACPVSGDANWQAVGKTKHLVRKLLAPKVPEEKFITCHAADTPAELRHLARTLLDPRNTRWFELRPEAAPRLDFLRWIESFKHVTAEHGLDLDDCCVVGSSSMEILGLRLSTDIDFTLPAARRYALFDAGVSKLNDIVDVVTSGYHRMHPPGVAVTDDELVRDSRHHFLFRGVKFANPNLIRDRKDYSRRPKDVADVERLNPWLARVQPCLGLVDGP